MSFDRAVLPRPAPAAIVGWRTFYDLLQLPILPAWHIFVLVWEGLSDCHTRNVEPFVLFVGFMGEEDSGLAKPVGVDPQRSVLYAQVASSDPRMAFDEEGVMHQFGTRGSFGKVYLGDVARAALRSLGTHDPPIFTRMPRVDEQNWELSCETAEIKMTISSSHYWGFGLFARCFLNRIVMEGSLPSRARCAMDIVSSLGRNPWEPIRVKAFERATSGLMTAHTSSWDSLISLARESMSDDISRLQDSVHRMRGVDEAGDVYLNSADEDLDRAREALADKNAPAVDRALSRASSAIVRADPDSDIGSMERELLGD